MTVQARSARCVWLHAAQKPKRQNMQPLKFGSHSVCWVGIGEGARLCWALQPGRSAAKPPAPVITVSQPNYALRIARGAACRQRRAASADALTEERVSTHVRDALPVMLRNKRAAGINRVPNLFKVAVCPFVNFLASRFIQTSLSQLWEEYVFAVIGLSATNFIR